MYEGFHKELFEKAYFYCQNDWSGREEELVTVFDEYANA